jgi:hypothetical protein
VVYQVSKGYWGADYARMPLANLLFCAKMQSNGALVGEQEVRTVSYAEYYAERWGRGGLCPDQPLLRARRVPRQNLLAVATHSTKQAKKRPSSPAARQLEGEWDAGASVFAVIACSGWPACCHRFRAAAFGGLLVPSLFAAPPAYLVACLFELL